MDDVLVCSDLVLTEMVKKANENFASFVQTILEDKEIPLSNLGLSLREIKDAAKIKDDPNADVKKSVIPQVLFKGARSGLFVFHTTRPIQTYGIIPIDQMDNTDKLILSQLMDKTDGIFYLIEKINKKKGNWDYIYFKGDEHGRFRDGKSH